MDLESKFLFKCPQFDDVQKCNGQMPRKSIQVAALHDYRCTESRNTYFMKQEEEEEKNP